MYVFISLSSPELPLPFWENFDKSSAKNTTAAMPCPVARMKKKVLVSFSRRLKMSLS